MLSAEHFDVKFTSREVSAWGGLALLKKMMDGMGVFQAIQAWQLPMPGSNRGYAPAQLLEQMMVSIWCGANRFVHSDITRLDKTLARLFGWSRVAEHKSIMRLFQRFDQTKATELQRNCFNWLFEKLHLNRITLDVDSTVITRWRKLPCQVDNLKLETSLTNFLGMNSIGATSPRDSCGLNSL